MKGHDQVGVRSDEDLMLAYQQGDSEAFNMLYDRIADQLYGYLRKRVKPEETVDDIFQNTLIKFHQTRYQYAYPLPVRAWVFTICRTVMVDAIRQRDRRREDLTGMEDFEQPLVSPQETASLPDELVNSRLLSKPQKDAISLRFESDLSFEEIAARLETSPANVRQLVSRALKKLRTLSSKKVVK